MSEKYWYLKRCDLFAHLTPEQLARTESRCRFRTFPRNSPVYLPADRADSVLLLASGRVKICSFTPDGRQGILTFIEPGELFGELALVEPGEREEYAEAVEDSTVVLIPVDPMQRLLEQHPKMSMGVTKLIGQRRRRIERRLKYLLFHSNRDRLIHLLVELAEQYGKTVGREIELQIKLSHQDLASVIGSTRETVTVILGQLQAEGSLRLGRRQITLTDIERLAETADIVLRPMTGPRNPPSAGASGRRGHLAKNLL